MEKTQYLALNASEKQFYNGKTADGIEVGFSLSNRPKLFENTPGWYHVRCYDRDILCQLGLF